jgi:succinate dehydrogenase / fumarate reductase, iron-sulfur subunit
MRKTVRVRIRRQDDAASKPYWDEFDVPYRPTMNVITLLLEIRASPVNVKGGKVAPVAWDCNCLEEVCGACTMVINGRPRQACSALVDRLKEPIVLRPLSKFPVQRDLVVDRAAMFESLKRIKAWVPIDGTYAIGHGPKMSKATARTGYDLSRCMTCGCCLEACPQVNPRTNYIGAAAIAQARLFNLHPTGLMLKQERLDALLEDGGINECGNAQNCERVCPKGIGLLASIAEMNRESVLHFLRTVVRA